MPVHSGRRRSQGSGEQCQLGETRTFLDRVRGVASIWKRHGRTRACNHENMLVLSAEIRAASLSIRTRSPARRTYSLHCRRRRDRDTRPLHVALLASGSEEFDASPASDHEGLAGPENRRQRRRSDSHPTELTQPRTRVPHLALPFEGAAGRAQRSEPTWPTASPRTPRGSL
jgi:hypothetical protein